MTYLVKWKAPKGEESDSEPDMCLVRGDVFKVVFPQVVIAFFEKHISWMRDVRSDDAKASDAAEQLAASREREEMDKYKSVGLKENEKENIDSINLELSSSENDSGSGSDERYEIDPDEA
jgi:hypothetical protein